MMKSMPYQSSILVVATGCPEVGRTATLRERIIPQS